MKARALFLKSNEEIIRLQELGLPIKEELESEDFYFDLEYVSFAFLSLDGNIVMGLQGEKWVLEFDADVWQQIKLHLSLHDLHTIHS